MTFTFTAVITALVICIAVDSLVCRLIDKFKQLSAASKSLYAWWLGLHDSTRLDIIAVAALLIMFLGAILLGMLPPKRGVL